MIPCINGGKQTMTKDKVMSYEEKSVGSTAFFKCEACPYMALAEDDMKFHLFTAHPELARSNGLAEQACIACPGCSAEFGAELPLRTHLRAHHKMGVRDVRKMVRSLVHLALKHVSLKKQEAPAAPPEPELKMPPVIEIAPDAGGAGAGLPRGVAYISVAELDQMSTPNFEKVDPKDMIQEASINIVYSEQEGARYGGAPELAGGVPPDLICSIVPRGAAAAGEAGAPPGPAPAAAREPAPAAACLVSGCHITLKEEGNLAYHRRCHQGGRLVCPECGKVLPSAEALHTHLWKLHAVDLELPTCPVCGYKTYRRYRLTAIHMKCHGTLRSHICPVCSKGFKTGNQLSKHKLAHSRRAACDACGREFSSARRLRAHAAAVHAKLRPFQCGHCPYAAARKAELQLHLRAHSGDKPYACDSCPHRASDHNAMRRHRRTHARAAPAAPAAAPAAPPPAPHPPPGEPAPAPGAPPDLPVRLPPAQASHILLTPGDTLPVRAAGAGPPAADGAPRKKPKISVKSNLILKGPDQESMFRPQFGLGAPVTFNNLISTQFLQPAGALFAEPYIKPEAGKAAAIKREAHEAYFAPAEPALDFLLAAGERYSPLLPDADVIEIDDNSDERKLPRFDNFPLESLYLMHGDFPFLEPELEPEPAPAPPPAPPPPAPAALHGDPMMNTCARATNKINVKNIELMKN